MYKYFPHTEADIEQMLKRISVKSVDDLFAEIPDSVVLKKEYDLPVSKSEIEIRKYFENLGNKNKKLTVFAGAGAYDHYAPSVVGPLISRSEFLTAYTPYQPEIAQGTLQYIFEYQSMICELTGMECTNASMYDGPTATAEAMFMVVASAKKKNTVLVSQTVNPNILKVVKTYAKYRGINIEEIAEKDGCTDKADMESKLSSGDVAGVIVSSPNYYGIIEDYTGYSDAIHAAKALFVMNTDPSALAVLKSPAEWGADIACGDGQSLGMPLNFGGSYIGFLASKKDLVRKLPGRIAGATTDVDGKRAFVLTLQAREQHIRREKANSNICSNQSLMALYVTIYMSLMGKEGLRDVNKLSYSGAHYLYDQLLATGKFKAAFEKPFLKEFAVKTSLNIDVLSKKLLDHGILGGIQLGKYKDGMDDCLLFCVTEKRSKEEIDQLVSLIKEV
ncbi:aminomethyl-transferring glycine dehydrogenase subunit GcvPA [Dysgonomonas sp. GY617]|uniref:aminomethyl-transferring glycine dehydrogenase subunit GcvPA n=1 Tax=Dysgonomonas sp. GY617 TaxID=2780420 RepID=UPI00188410EB|nr:aminomethyl-transferring glycine dehydrogenase subunit GcvPA [Dysgonomonas sp. GY617]MBF0576988.1 aminomethyl-transferring glycine dehydrogenase subunit GcvPA [Dysgonomonas sp. GY617]